METRLNWENACLTIRLPEELDHTSADELKRKTERFMNRYFTKTIIFDFQDTQFMDSSGIGLIMGRYRVLGLRGGCIQAINVSPYIERMLRISGVHKYINIQQTEKSINIQKLNRNINNQKADKYTVARKGENYEKHK